MQGLARRRQGLSAADVAMVEGWLVNAPEVISGRIVARENLETINRDRNAKKEDKERSPQALLFGRGLDRFGILPDGNVPALEAIAQGLLFRQPPDRDGWLSFLMRYVDRAEDPDIWGTIP